ncbi:MAG TPA: hypothetical protein VG317_07265 [Pseudonocardiaceae bacterium]|nr:hypothetical protein [Pseudonocardiaceae bacterium]
MSESEPSAPELLARALEHLEPAERKRVTAWCLSRMSGMSHFGWIARQERAEMLKAVPEIAPEASALYMRHLGGSLRGEHQTVPVRLPTELHTRLRTWSTENGFSMATVVRGLVSRFLDQQAPVEP